MTAETTSRGTLPFWPQTLLAGSNSCCLGLQQEQGFYGEEGTESLAELTKLTAIHPRMANFLTFHTYEVPYKD